MRSIFIIAIAFLLATLPISAADTGTGTGTGSGSSSENDWSDAAKERVVYNNGGYLPIYRIAFAVDYARFTNVFHSDADEYRNFCR